MNAKWHVLHLRPRCEKKMGEYSRILGLTFYLPLRVETKVYQRRRVTVHKPVFPCYFFVSFDPVGRLGLLQTNNVARVLKPERQRDLLHQLAQVRKALAVDPTLDACGALLRGKRVRIQGGPFQGIEGVVSALRGTSRVRLNVEMIGQAVALEVAREFLEVLP